MVGIVKALDSALKANNLEKVAQTMDQVGGSRTEAFEWAGGWQQRRRCAGSRGGEQVAV